MTYVVESGGSHARRVRRRRTLITLGVVTLMLFFAFWYAYSYYRDSGTPHAASAATCTATTGPLTPSQVTLNVYNATSRNGLAARTAAAVRLRGFRISTVSNDPLQKKVLGTAEVRYGTSAAASSKLVLALVRGAKAVPDARADASVDLVLGEKFTALAPPPKKAPAAKPTPARTTAPSAKRPTGATTSTPARTPTSAC